MNEIIYEREETAINEQSASSEDMGAGLQDWIHTISSRRNSAIRGISTVEELLAQLSELTQEVSYEEPFAIRANELLSLDIDYGRKSNSGKKKDKLKKYRSPYDIKK
jgi:hypothetical protein